MALANPTSFASSGENVRAASENFPQINEGKGRT